MIDPRRLIKKASLHFVAKFFCLLVGHKLPPTLTDNVVTSNKEVLLVGLVA